MDETQRKRRRRGTGTAPIRNFRLDDAGWARVNAYAARYGRTASDVIRDAIDHFLRA